MSQPLNRALCFKWRLTRNTSFYSPKTASLRIGREEPVTRRSCHCGLPPARWWLCGRDGVCSAALTDLGPGFGGAFLGGEWLRKQVWLKKKKITPCFGVWVFIGVHFQEQSENMLNLLPVVRAAKRMKASVHFDFYFKAQANLKQGVWHLRCHWSDSWWSI